MYLQVTEERGGDTLVSTLVIEKADMGHAGKFTCAPSYARPDTVTLHVVDGKILHYYTHEVIKTAIIHSGKCM